MQLVIQACFRYVGRSSVSQTHSRQLIPPASAYFFLHSHGGTDGESIHNPLLPLTLPPIVPWCLALSGYGHWSNSLSPGTTDLFVESPGVRNHVP
jgi:hypothetical protein